MRAVALLLFFASVALGEDLYFTQAGAGSHNGSSVGNAWSTSEASTSGNWGAGAGKVSAGDTLHVSGTITAALTVQGSGTAGNVITILFDSGAKFSAAAWANATGAITITNKNYITVDGGATGTIGGPGAAGTTNGVIEATANGTGLANQVDTRGLLASSCSNLTVQGLVFSNLYVRTRGTDASDGGSAVRVIWDGSNNYATVTVTNCVVHDVEQGISFTYGPATSAILVSYCTSYNCNWGGGAGDHNSSATLADITVHHCYFHDFTNWDGTDGTTQGKFHHNGFYAFAQSSGSITNITEYANVVSGPWTLNSGAPGATAGLFMSGGITGTMLIYNNVFLDAATGGTPDNGLLTIWPNPGSTARVYNNTFLGNGAGNGEAIHFENGNAGAKTFIAVNNVFKAKTAIAVYNNGSLTYTGNHNVFRSLISPNFIWSTDSTGNQATFAQWKALGGAFDPDGTTADPNLNGSYIPQPTSSAIDAGTSESTYFATDFYGVTRPSGSAWDIGAAEYVAASTAGSSATGSVSITGSASIK